MNSREILLYLSLKFNGDWDKIYKDLSEHKEYDSSEAKTYFDSFKGNYITFLDEEYPESLKQFSKPPFVIYYIGDISLISDKNNKLAVVGSRKHSDYGREVTELFVSKLAKDFVIVSGLAYGIDAIAHRSAMDAGGRTIAVLGNGVDFTYIKENEELYKEICKKHLVISEYPPQTPPNQDNFPIRNRIIVALCQNVLVTEGKLQSGTQITAGLMACKGGGVCCVPTRIGEESICNYLISEGAFLVETPEDVYEVANVVSKRPVFEN